MKRPLFLKIFAGVCASFVLVTYFVWLGDAILSVSPSRSSAETAQMALAGASAAIRLSGEQALREELATWPSGGRGHLTYRRIGASEMPARDPVNGIFATVAQDPKGRRYAITYRVTRFNGFVSPPLPVDIGPHVFFSALVGILIFSALLTLYLTIPIGRIRASFERLAAGDLKARMSGAFLRRSDEIAALASDFNKMASRLEELVTSRDRLLADISHELRSPLARLQLAIALARQSPEKTPQSLQRIGKEAEKLEEMVGELLALTRLESGRATVDEYFFASEIAAMVIEDARFEAQGKGVEIAFVRDAGAAPEALLVGSGKLISRAIENIVRNALRFSRKGHTITVEMDSNAAGTRLYIRDQGPGVKDEQLAALFEPFVQGDSESGQGYGLGLAIAKRAIIAHGGRITAANAAGAGLVITLWLPAAPDMPAGAEEARPVWDRSPA